MKKKYENILPDSSNIAVLLSGGVDSGLVVHELAERGLKPDLFYIRIGRNDGSDGCSAEEDIEICQLISKRYGLSLNVVSLHDEYWKYVMQYVIDSVKKGLTPHPDMMCNKIIKFGFFEERYGKDFDNTVSGHYAQKFLVDGDFYLAPGIDPVKDQTDFLSAISYEQFSHILFPIGALSKEEVRNRALRANLPNATRKDSQGICFLGKINYRDFIRNTLGVKKGKIVDIATGDVLGEHDGFWLYTIGQRKGLGLSGGPWFVIGKSAEENVIYVSKGYDTPLQYSSEIFMDRPHWITKNPFDGEMSFLKPEREGNMDTLDITFKNRHAPEFLKGKLVADRNLFKIESESKVQGVAPGQFVTIYTPDSQLCLGSAMITTE